MVGDYISTSFNASGLATTVFAVGRTPRGKSVQRVDVRPKFAVTGGVAVVGDTGRKQRRRAVNPRHRDGLPVAVDQAIARIEPTRHALKLLRREQLLSAPQLSRRYGRIDPNGRALSRPGRQAADKRFGGECFAE
jgi:hypothetical protein